MGRLAFRAGWDSPELEFVHINETGGDAATSAHLLYFDSVHGRWNREVSGAGDTMLVDGKSLSHTSRKDFSEVPWGDLGRGHRTRGEREIPPAGATGRLLQGRGEKGHRRRAGQRQGIECRHGRQRPPLRAGHPPSAHGRVLHHQLPGAGGEGAPRENRHQARDDHHHPRHDQYPVDTRHAAQGPAPRAGLQPVIDPDIDRLRHRHRHDFPGTAGQARRPGRARAPA